MTHPSPSRGQKSNSRASQPTSSGPRPSAPRGGRRRTLRWVLIGAAILVGGTAAVLLARWLLGVATVAAFVEENPGYYAQDQTPAGYPWWLNWTHFFNAFLIALIIKTGLQIRTETRPPAYWTPRWNRKRKISITIWLHQSLNLLWVLNGVVFGTLLMITGYWSRVTPTSWEVFPNAASAAVQYLSLDWPTDHQWAHYNSLQELAYFTTIFIAAPLAILTGVRMSGLWPSGATALSKVFPMALARKTHLVTMIYFSVFIITHVFLVLATGALRNLNQIYTGQDTTNWLGFWLFIGSLVVIAGGVAAARAVIVAPIASLTGRVGR